MEKIKCTIDKIYYQDANNGFSVLGATLDGMQTTKTVVGNNLQDIQPGMVIDAYGDWKDDKRYGKQFKVVSWQEALPTSIVGMEKYLGSGQIKGIGPTIAKKIVNQFGLQSFDIIENDIERLKEIPDIGTKRIKNIRDCWVKQKEIRQVMVFLHSLGVSSGIATGIFQVYEKDSIKKIKQNPYDLIDDVSGIGFKTADEIAMKLGFSKDDPKRCKHGILYEMNEATTAGHVFTEEGELFRASTELLETDERAVGQTLFDMINSQELIEEGNAIYLPTYYYAEKGVAKRMKALCKQHVTGNVDVDALLNKGSVVYDATQKVAIEAAIHNNVIIMTGCPGTGKSVTTLGIITILKAMGQEVLLAAPTGRAAKRLSQATSMNAKTIHRLLEIGMDGKFTRNADNPLEGDALIVDEASMIDILLMYSLLKAAPDNMRLILVGDVDQLPSVGAGTVLQDIIESGIAPVVRLTKIFRQAQGSSIITNAHLINQGKMPQLANDSDSDFEFYDIPNEELAMKKIVDLVKQCIPQDMGFSHDDIQVLSPMQNGNVGVRNLNIELQKALNPVGDYLYGGGYQYRKGDRVMQIKNNYETDTFNGDIGVVDSVDQENHILKVSFDGRIVDYDDMEELTLAYATTIHKSQGSEYPVVIIPLMDYHHVMLQRKLIYTAITRAKKLCVIVGSPSALRIAVNNSVVQQRNSKLKDRLMP